MDILSMYIGFLVGLVVGAMLTGLWFERRGGGK